MPLPMALRASPASSRPASWHRFCAWAGAARRRHRRAVSEALRSAPSSRKSTLTRQRCWLRPASIAALLIGSQYRRLSMTAHNGKVVAEAACTQLAEQGYCVLDNLLDRSEEHTSE